MSHDLDRRTVMETLGYPVHPGSLTPATENSYNFSDRALAELYFEGVLNARDRGYAEEIEYKQAYEINAPRYARDRITDLAQEREAFAAVTTRRNQVVQEFLGFFM